MNVKPHGRSSRVLGPSIGGVLLCVVLGPFLSACGGGDDAAAPAASDGAPSTGAAGSPSTTPSSDSSPTDGAAPATGTKLTVGSPTVATFRLPAGWRTDGGMTISTGGIDLDDTTFQTKVIVATFPNVGDPSLASYTRTVLAQTPGGRPGPSAEVGAEPARTILSTTAKAREVQYVVLHDGQAVTADFTFSKKRPQEEQDSIIASVLATWQWA